MGNIETSKEFDQSMKSNWVEELEKREKFGKDFILFFIANLVVLALVKSFVSPTGHKPLAHDDFVTIILYALVVDACLSFWAYRLLIRGIRDLEKKWYQSLMMIFLVLKIVSFIISSVITLLALYN